PGHQGTSLKVTDSPRKRGYYVNSPTYGGFDIMTATVGGVWDSFLGEGRRFWITATSDSHRNVEDGGEDLWPGQYAKTYVWAAPDQADIMDGLRHGRIFVTTGDLISELDMDIAGANVGDTAQVKAGQVVTLKVRLRDPAGPNANSDQPELKRVDVIMGDITGKADVKADSNPTTRVIKRFTAADWTRDGEVITFTYSFKAERDGYIRLRGTSTDELEPQADALGENPWPDLWFYSNPIFIRAR
ncbi:MAG: phosphoesterase, partial [Asticcacaulis sp. 32-58-5]